MHKYIRVASLAIILVVVCTFAAFSQSVNFSSERGFYNASFQLTLTTSLTSSTIRYTLNGTEPTTITGVVYSGPITISTTSVIRAIAYNGSTASPVETHSYIFLNDVIMQPANISGWSNYYYQLGTGSDSARHDYEMDPNVVNNPAYSSNIISAMTAIPTMSIVMDFDDFWESYDGEDIDRETSVEILYVSNSSMNEQFDCEIESHSHKRLKRSLKLKFPDPVSSDIFKHAPLHSDMAAQNFFETGIVLRAGNNRAWSRNWRPDRTAFTRDQWYRDSEIAISGEGARGTFVHLYVNGLYWGLYNPTERPDVGYAAEYFGGSYLDWMGLNHNGIKDGNPARFNYLKGALIAKDMTVSANYLELQQYLDVEKFCDYMIITWITGMTDWPQNNFYGINRNVPPGPFRYKGWDCEWSWDNAAGGNEGGWVHPLFASDSSSNGYPIVDIWHSARQNPEFMQLFADRVYKHCFNNGGLTDDASRARWAALNDFISEAVIGESARWGDGLEDGITRTKNDHWQPEVDRVDLLMNGNAARFLAALQAQGYYSTLVPPAFNKETGAVQSGFQLTMTNTNGSGTVYFTLDGTDPRITGGATGPSAIAYSGPITISGLNTIKARVKDGNNWSALHEGIYSLLNLRINEFLASNVNGLTDEFGEHEDWIEIHNMSPVPVDIGGMYITDNLSNPTSYQIPTSNPSLTTITANGYILLWADNTPAQGIKHVNIKLSKSGEQLGLADAFGAYLDSLSFGVQADDISTGRYPNGTGVYRTFNIPTPGAPNTIGFQTGIFINEFIAGNANGIVDEMGDHEDWIEIYNSNNAPVDIGGMYVTDNLANPLAYQLPDSIPTVTTIPANGFLILWADNELTEGPLHIVPKLSKGGEAIGLTQVIGGDQEFIDSLTFGAQTDDISQGRYPDGNAFQRFFAIPTPGAPNVIPFVSGLYINEFLAVNSTESMDEFNEFDDWIEIYNSNADSVNIGGKFLTNNLGNPSLWQIPTSDPQLTTIPPHGFIRFWADNQPTQGPLHVGFTLSDAGGEIGLVEIIGFDTLFIDSINYSVQVTDISYGRYPDASANLISFNTPTPETANVLPVVSNLYINEFLASNDSGLTDEFGGFDDWIEIYNANAFPVDLGGLFVTDALSNPSKFQIPNSNPALTTIPANGFLLLWADEESFQGVRHVNIKLSAGGEQIGLIQINGTTTTYIDSLTFGSQITDISRGRLPDGGTTFVSFTQPTPGASNVVVAPVDSISFTLVNSQSDLDIGPLTDGSVINFATLPTNQLNIRANTIPNVVGSIIFGLDGNNNFNTENTAPYALAGDAGGDYNAWTPSLGNHTLTGTSYSGSGGSGSVIATKTISFTVINNATVDCNNEIGGSAMIDSCGICAGGTTGIIPNSAKDDCGVCNGNNALKDCNGDCGGSASIDNCGVCSGGNTGIIPNSTIECFSGLKINEFLASNDSGMVDEFGEHEDWIELYNSGSVPVDVGGLYITDDLSNPTLYQIPDTNATLTTIPVNGFLLLWADKDLSQGINHVNIKLSTGGEQIGLVAMDGFTPVFIDSLTFGSQTTDISTGRYHDGSDTIITFLIPTPGQPNQITFQSGLYINEFLAGNDTGLVDEMGDHEDWIEIYNSTNKPIDIGGMFVTDNLANPFAFKITDTIPASTIIPAGGFLLLWADNELTEGPLHISTKLSKGGEAIGLTQVIAGEHQYIDSLTFGPQTDDISTGRYPDGSNNFVPFTIPTPNASNNGIMDCNNVIGGTAIIDSCGICSGGNTGIIPNSAKDCNGDCNGTAALDFCGVCTGGNTGVLPNLNIDCNGVCEGTAIIDSCGICSGGNTGKIPNATLDCFGVCGGTAFIDSCGICAGGSTGIIPNANLDCNGDCFGTAIIDSCGICSGGNTTIVPNSAMDCHGDCNGTAFIDTCGICAGGNTSIQPNVLCGSGTTTVDCNGVINGNATLDTCGVCSGGNTGNIPNLVCGNDSTPVDCFGVINGTATLDSCWVCSGGTTGNIPNQYCGSATVIVDCNGVLGGFASIDTCGVCSGGNTGIARNASCGPCKLTVTTSKKNTSCFGFKDGSASISVSGGIPPYTYEWSTIPIVTTMSIRNQAAGDYSVTVSDNNGCNKSKLISISDASSLLVFSNVQNSNPSGSSTGSITLSVIGGTGSYHYQWTHGVSAPNCTFLLPGNYYCEITDDKGCSMILAVQVF